MTAPLYPSEDLRKRLEKLGVPREKHNLAELGEMLPTEINNQFLSIIHLPNNYGIKKMDGKWICLIGRDVKTLASSEANAKVRMLIYLFENKLMEIPK